MSDSSATSVKHAPRGLLIVITGASGVGKGTLREKWLKGQNVFYSTSWTTRKPREGEQNGREYKFVTPEEFAKEVAENGFLEHAQFVGNHYGTPIKPIEAALASGQDVILEIEVEGAMQVKQRMGEQAILVFIMPPSLTELERRLKGRATETPESIQKRLNRAREEIRAAHEFRYVVVNDDLERAAGQLLAVQQAERAAQKPRAEWTAADQAAHEVAQSVHSRTWSTEALARVVNS